MEDELENFLIFQCGIDGESIATMKQQKIDFATIRAMSPTELGKFVERVGDVYKIKEFASSQLNQCKPLSSTLATLAQKLKTKLAQVEGTTTGAKITKSSPKLGKPTRKITVTWKCDNKIVRIEEGGGARQIDALKISKKKDILEKATGLYFPKGKSVKRGFLEDYNVDLLDFAGNSFDENLTIEEIFAITGFTRLNFCLHTISKYELPEKRKKKKKRTRKEKTQKNSSSSSSEDKVPTKKRPQRKQYSKYSISISSSSSEPENQNVEVFPSRETTTNFSTDDFDLDEFLKIPSSDPILPTDVDVVVADVELPVAATHLQNADIFTKHDDSPTEVLISSKEPLDLQSELTLIRQAIEVENPVLVNVCREDPMSSMRNAMTRSTFSPYKKIDVQFVDVDEVPEGAIDEGGPSRELFRLCLKQLENSEIFLGKEGSKILTLNLTALGKKKNLHAGKLFALSIIHGGPRPNFLSKTIFDYLANGFAYPLLDDLKNTPFEEAIKNIKSTETLESFKKVLSTCDELLDLGVSTASFNEKNKLIEEILHHMVIDRPRRALEQFADGLETLNILFLIRKYPEQASFLFCNKEETQLTAKYLNQLFCIKRSSDGTQRRALESRITAFWRDYLQNCEDGDCQVCLSDILAFATGCNTEPALGFDKQPTIEFLHEDPSVFPKSNTCGLILYLPIAKSDDYETYRENLTFGILNGLPTFGLS